MQILVVGKVSMCKTAISGKFSIICGQWIFSVSIALLTGGFSKVLTVAWFQCVKQAVRSLDQ